MLEDIVYESSDGVATITLNRASRKNSFRKQTQREVIEACRRANEDTSLRVVVITGAGDSFCAGADIKEMDNTEEYDITSAHQTLRHDWEFYSAIRSIRAPLVAKINGDAVGGGSNIVMTSDIRIASENARLGFPFVNIGLCGADGGCTYYLPRAVGYAKAAELIFTGGLISATEAKEIGLVNRVVAPDELDAAVGEIISQLARKSPLALRNAKQALSKSLDLDIATEYDHEMLVTTECMLSHDFREGMAAFKEKREPHFTGR